MGYRLNVELDTTEAHAREAYEIWIQVIEDNPKPWAALRPEQRAIWIRSIEDLECVASGQK